MRDKFFYWLSSYKLFSNTKAENAATVIDNLSDEMYSSKIISSALFNSDSFVSFAKSRKSIINARDLSPKEKKALNLYGDFLQFVEYSNYSFPKLENGPLLQYCRVMKTTYSYKPVLLLALIENNAQNGWVSLANVIQSFCDYYDDRLANGLTAENQNSIFSKELNDYKQAKAIIMNNPVAVLKKDGVVITDEESSGIAFSSKYLPDEEIIDDVVNECNAKLDSYYGKLSDSCEPLVNHTELIQTLNTLSEIINNDSDGQRKKASLELIQGIRKLWEYQPADNADKQINKACCNKLSLDDPRKVGKLVKEEMTILSDSGISFSAEEVECLTDKIWSKEHLHLYYSFLKKYDPNQELNEQRRDHLGNGRYWNKVFTFGEEQFLITSEWYADSKSLFIEWYNKRFCA